MDKFKEIRPISLGLVISGNRLLLSEGYDKVKDEYFYRPIGGGIDFQETSEQALIREFEEEIGANIKVIEKLDVVDNIFVFDGMPAHEIIFLFRVEFPEEQILEEYHIHEDSGDSIARWIEKSDIISGRIKVYPEIKRYI